VWYNDIRHERQWLGNFYKETDELVASLDEPPVEKTKSVKANATVAFLIENGKRIPVKGKIILYFQKDSLPQGLAYGSQIVFTKPLQEIKNSGNPGGFDYKQYCLFQKITHQVYLKPGEFTLLPSKNENRFNKFLYTIREKVITIIRKYIPGEREQGLAEALLIGYKDDLDRNLVQSYTNTGVVHIIVIAGLHLGVIYWVLLLLTRPLKKRKKLKWLRPVVILSGLWLFSLATGAHVPVMRSTVMLTFIVLAESIDRKSSVYNTFAASAFLLLCYNPFWIWDVGFQLSYAAVVSIVTFTPSIYNWFYIKNKALDFIWKLNAVSIAAQLLTLPFSIYHFHQFPNYFLLTNFVAVPLALVILLGEIFLCVISFIPFIAIVAGKLLSWLIRLMNTYIERIENLPGSLWDGLQISILQTVLLFVFVAGAGFWLMEKSKPGLKASLIGLLGFIALRSYSFLQMNQQKKIIVYNVPQQQAIDVIDGRNYFFLGDSSLLEDDFPRNFHLKPSRILYRIAVTTAPDDFHPHDKYITCGQKRIMLIDEPVSFVKSKNRQPVDLLVISKNPKIYISRLVNSFEIKQIVFDGSVPAWRLNYWKKDCDSLHIPYYDVNEKGAFVMKLN
ncbi:MAG: ComEC/Rec2 family competence protein, partial [Chitinophagales bacterium]